MQSPVRQFLGDHGRPTGEIALACLGTSDGQKYNGYITEGLNDLGSMRCSGARP